MNNYKFYFSRRIAEDKICDAKTPEQVKAAMRKSCELCQWVITRMQSSRLKRTVSTAKRKQ